MNWLSSIRTRYRQTQRLLAERALQQGKRRFVWVRGVLSHGGFGLVFVTISEFQRSRQVSPKSWDLGYVLFALMVCSVFGYWWANWKWKDYEQMRRR
jgi:hypothetical protein